MNFKNKIPIFIAALGGVFMKSGLAFIGIPLIFLAAFIQDNPR